jgi:hypothetical protein
MKESRIYITAFIISFIVGFIVSGLLMSKCSKPQDIIKTDTITITDTMWKDTTIIEKEFIPKEVIKKKVDTLYLENGDTMTLTTEQKKYEKSIVSDKDTADVEIYVTGINTALDSLKMRLKTHTITNTVEITKIVERKKTFKDRFHIEPQVGIGYGMLNKKVDAYVGVGLGIDIW